MLSPGPKSLPTGRNRPLPGGRHRGLFLDENPVLGVKPRKSGRQKILKNGLMASKKRQNPTPGTMVWVTCAANHSPTARKPVSQKGVSRISQDFFRVHKSVIPKNLRRSFEQRQVSPGRERMHFRQMFTVDLKKWCPNIQIGFHLSWTRDHVVISTWLLRTRIII